MENQLNKMKMKSARECRIFANHAEKGSTRNPKSERRMEANVASNNSK
jgi:hypothetical protein